MLNKKYESITGIELPIKIPTIKRIYKIKDYSQERNVIRNSEFIGDDWGRAVNNPCELRKLKNGVEIEVYRCCGNISSVFIIK